MRSILVVVTRQIGDVLLTTPLIEGARRLWPAAAIDVVGLQGTLGMLEGNPAIRRRIAVPQRPGFAGTLALARRLWRRYDLVFVADPGDRAHLLGFLASRQRSGVVAVGDSSAAWKRRLLRHVVDSAGDRGTVHVVEERLALLAPWLEGGTPRLPVVAPPAEALPLELQRRLAPGYVAVHTPSMWPYKQWPLGHFRKLVAGLAASGRQVVLTGGPGEADRECVQAMAGAAPEGMLLDAGVLGFAQLASLLREAALYVGPDTSVSHLAAACATPVLAIFGPTNPQRWAPWPTPDVQPVHFHRVVPSQTIGNVTLMQASLPCVPCSRAGCDDHRGSRAECLPAIDPDRVLEQALAVLGKKDGHEHG